MLLLLLLALAHAGTATAPVPELLIPASPTLPCPSRHQQPSPAALVSTSGANRSDRAFSKASLKHALVAYSACAACSACCRSFCRFRACPRWAVILEPGLCSRSSALTIQELQGQHPFTPSTLAGGNAACANRGGGAEHQPSSLGRSARPRLGSRTTRVR